MIGVSSSLDLLARRTQKRIAALERVGLREYEIALYELRGMLDLLERAANYIKRGEDRRWNVRICLSC
jgi:hypothetical protein